MVQVVGNLLNNAAKYMQEGGRIHLTAFADGGTAVIRVRDEGVGIPPEMLGRIFQRFIQLGSSGHRAEGGLGIGLSLVKAWSICTAGVLTPAVTASARAASSPCACP